MPTEQDIVDVAVVGAGPVGLWLARELTLGGVRVRVLERDTERSPYIRAFGLQPRSLEILDMRGLLSSVVSERSRKLPVANVAGLLPWLTLAGLDTSHPYGLSVRQNVVEEIIEASLAELGVLVDRGDAAVGLDTTSPDSVDVKLESGDVVTARYVVGCDGAHSAVRKLAGIDFPGSSATATYILADVTLAEPPEWLGQLGIKHFPAPDGSRLGWFMGGTVPDTGRHRIMLCDRQSAQVVKEEPVSFEELRELLVRLTGSDCGAHSPTWLSRVGNPARVAAQYRAGRVLLAGDAAHVHSPFGGQGLNTGLQDATNLGWKLAAVARGDADEELLDTYHHERHPIGKAVIANTMAQTTMVFDFTPGGQHLRDLVSRLLEIPDVNSYLAGQITALDYAYPPADEDAHPLVGARLPNLSLRLGDGTGHLYDHFQDAAHILLSRTGATADTGQLPAVSGEVKVVHGWPDEPREGWDDAQTVLIRPDGHIAAVTTTA
ncbi:FAD-dependent monooxygenase [Streptomyces kanamyceticus]|uniref:FAD-dependent monooxygenase n=1 Tax=Streptomyces kanamyceticus TaxID=1967 RepID=UPI0007C648BD|nr:FAD-dependent monooxygenase [Streptomyces kanamyceticus]